MLDTLFNSGKLEKMLIRAYKPQVNKDSVPELSKKEEDKYQVQVNPESLSANLRIKWDYKSAPGNSGAEATYAGTRPSTYRLEFLFDGTGVIPKPAGPLDNVPIAGGIADLISGEDDYDVMEQLKAFMHVVYNYSGDDHRPRKVQLAYGKLTFDGVLTSMDIEYKLFKPDGSPLRAVAKASFAESITDEHRENKEKKSSPDLTHLVTVHEGDTLPLLSNDIYRNPNYYLEVARSNKLYSFRQLPTGSRITFPPINKTQR
ncbi:MAG: LysM peptidoglycan-binding domain-containing protein [Bacteroidota bacterium]